MCPDGLLHDGADVVAGDVPFREVPRRDGEHRFTVSADEFECARLCGPEVPFHPHAQVQIPGKKLQRAMGRAQLQQRHPEPLGASRQAKDLRHPAARHHGREDALEAFTPKKLGERTRASW
jgi:hypothetical protein